MNGILIVNKPAGCTSHDVVKNVKKIFNEKVGHTGTLDPMATGVLPLLIGKGTLCSKYLINHDKTYRVVLELGKKTDTADREGNVIEEVEVQRGGKEFTGNKAEGTFVLPRQENMDTENVKAVLASFVGKQMQTPPMYSAIKVKGKKLYEYARKGIQVEVKPREIEIYKIELLGIHNASTKKGNSQSADAQKYKVNFQGDDAQNHGVQIEFKVDCSKGTYIRSLCEDIAKKLGTVGFMAELERLRVGEFDIKNAVEIKDIKPSSLISIEELFKNAKSVELDENKLNKFLNGVKIKCTQKENGPCKVYCNDKFVGIGVQESGKIKRDIII